MTMENRLTLLRQVEQCLRTQQPQQQHAITIPQIQQLMMQQQKRPRSEITMATSNAALVAPTTILPPLKKRIKRESDASAASSTSSTSTSSTTSLQEQQPSESPSKFVLATFKEHGFNIEDEVARAEKDQTQTTQAMVENYTQDKLMAVRRNELNLLEELHASGVPLQCCNKFGESIVHLACRRSHTSIVKFLVRTAGVTLNHADDYKRTPMHDACWTPEPNFDLMLLLLEEAPEQLVLKDVRGFTPFDYVRKADWSKWMRFLKQHKDLLKPKQRQETSPTTKQ